MTVDHDTLVGLWRMDPKLVPTFEGDGWTARIIWQPVGVCSWRLTSGDGRSFSTLDRFRDAREAKEDLWLALTGQGAIDVVGFIERMNAERGPCRKGGRPAPALQPRSRAEIRRDSPPEKGPTATGREARLGQPPKVKPTAVGPPTAESERNTDA